jgi:arginine N-succinyltransferase
MIPERARSVIGVPHTSGRAAMRMLEEEGFAYENYIDIFDGGPTMTAPTDRIATIKAAQEAEVVAVIENPGEGFEPALLAHGRLGGFRACLGAVAPSEGGVAIPAATARLLGIDSGQTLTWVPTGAPA